MDFKNGYMCVCVHARTHVHMNDDDDDFTLDAPLGGARYSAAVVRALFADANNAEAADGRTLLIVLRHMNSDLRALIERRSRDVERPWFGFYSTPNDLQPWGRRFFEQASNGSTRTMQVLERYRVAHGMNQERHDLVLAVLLIAATRGTFNERLAGTGDTPETFIRRANDLLGTATTTDPRDSVRRAIDAYAFTRYATLRRMLDEPRRIFGDVAAASRKSAALRGWASAMRQRATATEDALELIAVQLEHWNGRDALPEQTELLKERADAEPVTVADDDDDDDDALAALRKRIRARMRAPVSTLPAFRAVTDHPRR